MLILPDPPIRLLFISGIIGGIATPISLAFLLIVTGNKKIMHDLRPCKVLLAIGWLTALIVAATSAYFIAQLL